MMYICDSTDKTIKTWHVREGMVMVDITDVGMIQAYGDELEFIRTNFDNVPISKTSRTQNWRGDLAKFIVENIQ